MTSRPPSGDDFASSFLEDYFAECEEHLARVRRALLAMEDSIGVPEAHAPLLEELFRSFHSLKGISAMVDVREAERLAHELESFLRALRDGEQPLTSDTVTVLIDTTAALESVIAARRDDHPPVAIEPALQRLSAAIGASRPADRAALAAGPRKTEDARGRWRFTFVPSPALVERGIKVDTIRQRLGSIGRLEGVAPKVVAGGGIAFEFLVTASADESPFLPWRDDGLRWERIEEGAADEPAGLVPAAAFPAPDPAAILASSNFVRVDLKRLDGVMRRVADLVVTRARLERDLARVERIVPAQEWRRLQENSALFERQLRDLREDVMRVRLVRVDEVFRRMPFVARDVARETGVNVRVVLTGQDTEIDKFLVERMMDPLLHLVRNAVSHGIERPEARVAAGKPAQGVVTLKASTVGETVLLEVADDGAGIDAASVAARARAAGMHVPDGALDAQMLVELICEPGLSTRSEADRASGRGVGMTVVRNTIRELGGTLRVETEVGRGTRFSIGLPLTLAITDALIAVAGGQTFAVPQSSVQELIEVEASAIRQLERHELVPYRSHTLPLLRLSTLFGLPDAATTRFHAFVIGSGQDAVALAVDRILGQREIVVRTMSDALLKVDGISGATELGDGRVVLILDAAALARPTMRGPRPRAVNGAVA